MFTTLAAQNWGMFVFRGVLSILIGVLAFAAPGPTLAALVFVFAAYAVVDGALAILAGIALPVGPRWLLVLGGILAVAIGIYTFANPSTTATALVYLIAAFAIVRGIAEIATAITYRPIIQDAFLLGLSGVLSIVFGGLLVASPSSGALAVIWIIGFYALLVGGTYVYLGFKLRGVNKAIEHDTAQPTDADHSSTAAPSAS
jgi:uncharacterized membrane protein HdeD (DUF308 family)